MRIGAKGHATDCAASGFLSNLRRLVLSLLLVVLLPACASTTQEAEEEDWEDSGFGESYAEEVDDAAANDPFEIPNRFIFAFNEALDVVILRPAAVTYRFLVPQGLRDAIRNFLRNLSAPVILANDLFQGNLERADTTFSRFVVNTSVGMLGFLDVAEPMGLAYHEEDFGQTLGHHGIGEGFYIVLPLLGPSNLRDASGRVVDYFIDPFTYILTQEQGIARFAVSGLDKRERNIETLDEIQKDSVDFYARVRSLYSQHRDNLIRNGDDEFGSPALTSELPVMFPGGLPN